MKFLRPRSADSGMVTVLLVRDVELEMLVEAVASQARVIDEDQPVWRKLKVELETARRAL